MKPVALTGIFPPLKLLQRNKLVLERNAADTYSSLLPLGHILLQFHLILQWGWFDKVAGHFLCLHFFVGDSWLSAPNGFCLPQEAIFQPLLLSLLSSLVPSSQMMLFLKTFFYVRNWLVKHNNNHFLRYFYLFIQLCIYLCHDTVFLTMLLL